MARRALRVFSLILVLRTRGRAKYPVEVVRVTATTRRVFFERAGKYPTSSPPVSLTPLSLSTSRLSTSHPFRQLQVSHLLFFLIHQPPPPSFACPKRFLRSSRHIEQARPLTARRVLPHFANREEKRKKKQQSSPKVTRATCKGIDDQSNLFVNMVSAVLGKRNRNIAAGAGNDCKFSFPSPDCPFSLSPSRRLPFLLCPFSTLDAHASFP